MRPVLTQLLRDAQRNILAGIITIGPLIVTWLVFSFVFGILAKAGLPVVRLIEVLFPGDWIGLQWLQSALAVLMTLVVLYFVGRITSEVVGREAFSLFEAALQRLPFVAKVYTSVRQLIDTMMAKKDTSQRVVLIDFLLQVTRALAFSPGRLLTQPPVRNWRRYCFRMQSTPHRLFCRLLPLDRVVETDLTMEQAMSMLMTGGAVAPGSHPFLTDRNCTTGRGQR